MNDDLIKRAYSSLSALRQSLQGMRGLIGHRPVLLTSYGNALANLREAGFDTTEWELSHSGGEPLSAVELLVKVDTVLNYFSVAKKQIGVGAHRS